MLSRRQRLSSNKIEYLFKKGKKVARDSLVVKYLPTPGPQSRFCVVVSTKTEAKAVKRNLLRRRIYEILRLYHPKLRGSYDMVIVTQTPLLKQTYQTLQKNLTNLLQDIIAHS